MVTNCERGNKKRLYIMSDYKNRAIMAAITQAQSQEDEDSPSTPLWFTI